MKRRRLCASAALAALAPLLPLRAQPARVARLGVLSDSPREPAHDALLERLSMRGWVENRNLLIEYRTLDEDASRSAHAARQLARLKCDAILAHGTAAALAAHAEAPKVPMVFVIAGDPVLLGMVATLQRPGGHATGYAPQSHEIAIRQLSLLRELAPAAKHVAVMFQAGNPSMVHSARTVEAAAQPLGLSARRFALRRGGQDVVAAHLALRREPADGLLVLFDRATAAERWNITRMASQLHLPAVYGSRLFAEEGGLVSFGIDWAALLVGSADYVARVLDGARPADLPVQQPTRFELVVNRQRARTLGVTLPQAVLLQATEVLD